MRAPAWGALLLVMGLIGVAAPAAAAGLPMAFPMLVEPPKASGPAHVDAKDRIAFVQPVRSAQAVRLTVEQVLEYKPEILDRKFTKGGVRRVTFPAGSIFVLALSDAGELYCAAGSDRSEGWMTFYDVGVCYRDTDGDAVFDERFLIEPNSRARVPYEILVREAPTWIAARAPYVRMAQEEIPAAEFRILYSYFDPPLAGPTVGAQLNICWPEALVLPKDDKGDRELCSMTTWDVPVLAGGQVYIPPTKAKPGLVKQLAWGPFQAEIALGEKGAADVTVSRHYDPGLALMFLSGAWRSTGDYRYQTSIFDFRSVAVRPSPAAPAADGLRP